jgi:hypothetical protein
VQGARIARVVTIDFLKLFAASNSRFRCIYYNADVTVIVAVWNIARLMSAADKFRYQYCHAPKRKFSSVEKMYCLAFVT